MIPHWRLKLGWSNPDTGPTSLRLYALDQGDQPRWTQPHARVAEMPLIEAGAHEGSRYVLLRAEDFDRLLEATAEPVDTRPDREMKRDG